MRNTEDNTKAAVAVSAASLAFIRPGGGLALAKAIFMGRRSSPMGAGIRLRANLQLWALLPHSVFCLGVGSRDRAAVRLWFEVALRSPDLRLLELAVVAELQRRWWPEMGEPWVAAMAGRACSQLRACR